MTSFGEFEIVCRTVYGEARGEPREGKYAVVWVIRNRAGLRGYGGPTLDGVCLKKFQFSCWNKSDPMRPKIVRATGEQLANCLVATFDVLMDKVPDPTNGSMHYLNPEVTRRIRPDGKLPDWARDEYISAKIGKHFFYRIEEK